MEKLKKCPFCNEGLEIVGNGHYYAHKTNGCILQHLCFECDDVEAITAWNTRKPMERIVERVHGYFVSEINALPIDEIPHDILQHNKQICKIVKEELNKTDI